MKQKTGCKPVSSHERVSPAQFPEWVHVVFIICSGVVALKGGHVWLLSPLIKMGATMELSYSAKFRRAKNTTRDVPPLQLHIPIPKNAVQGKPGTRVHYLAKVGVEIECGTDMDVRSFGQAEPLGLPSKFPRHLGYTRGRHRRLVAAHNVPGTEAWTGKFYQIISLRRHNLIKLGHSCAVDFTFGCRRPMCPWPQS